MTEPLIVDKSGLIDERLPEYKEMVRQARENATPELFWALALREAGLGRPLRLAAMLESCDPPPMMRKSIARLIIEHWKPPRKNAQRPPLGYRVELAGNVVRWITRNMTAQELRDWRSNHLSSTALPGFHAPVRVTSKKEAAEALTRGVVLPPPVRRKDRPTEPEAISAAVIFMREQHPDWDFTSKDGEEGGKIANFLHGRRGASRRRKIRLVSGR